jgi:hypothetical protein
VAATAQEAKDRGARGPEAKEMAARAAKAPAEPEPAQGRAVRERALAAAEWAEGPGVEDQAPVKEE